MDSTRTRMRSTNAQLKFLVDFMALNPTFANGGIGGPLGIMEQAEKWETLAKLLAEHGPSKTVDQWKTSWRDLKKNARSNKKKLLDTSEEDLTEHTKLHLKILSIIADEDDYGENGPNSSVASLDESQDVKPKKMRFQNFVLIKKGCDDSVESPPPKPKAPRQPKFVLVRKGCDNPDDYREPEPKKRREDIFITVTRCFVNLVKMGACSLSLFDEAMFRDVIDLIPMTRGEKDRISSEYIQTFIQNDTGCCLDQDTDVDNTAETDETNLLEDAVLIKGELETVLCTCGKDSDGTMTSHSVDCASSEQQTFMKYFDVSLHSATCHICNGAVAWTDRDTLRRHLQTKHPDVECIDEGEQDKDVTSDEDSSNDIGIEEVFLDENLPGNGMPMKCPKKRRKKSKLPLFMSGPMTRENIAAGLQRLKSLDHFGPYVVSLLKSIPRDKSIKFQIEMVERLLHEQAVAA